MKEKKRKGKVRDEGRSEGGEWKTSKEGEKEGKGKKERGIGVAR